MLGKGSSSDIELWGDGALTRMIGIGADSWVRGKWNRLSLPVPRCGAYRLADTTTAARKLWSMRSRIDPHKSQWNSPAFDDNLIFPRRGFETGVNKSDAVKEVKKDKGDDIAPKEKKELTAEEKEY